jgi:hypothetical protein
MNCLMTEQLFYAVLLAVPCLLGASVSLACAHDQRLILTDHARKARWIGTPERSIDFQAQDAKLVEMWFTEPAE